MLTFGELEELYKEKDEGDWDTWDIYEGMSYLKDLKVGDTFRVLEEKGYNKKYLYRVLPSSYNNVRSHEIPCVEVDTRIILGIYYLRFVRKYFTIDSAKDIYK